MNHQPFENWLLSEEPISHENKEQLDRHLENCEQCQELSTSWQSVVDLFQEVPDNDPVPGFVNRWQERLLIERRMELTVRNRWQSIIVLILIGNVIAGLVFLLSTQFLSTFESPLSLLLSGVSRLTSFLTFFNAIQNIFLTLFRTITGIVPPGVWAILGIGLVGACITWIISITSLSLLPGGRKL